MTVAHMFQRPSNITQLPEHPPRLHQLQAVGGGQCQTITNVLSVNQNTSSNESA
jgi:hypothetical protein